MPFQTKTHQLLTAKWQFLLSKQSVAENPDISNLLFCIDAIYGKTGKEFVVGIFLVWREYYDIHYFLREHSLVVSKANSVTVMGKSCMKTQVS